MNKNKKFIVEWIATGQHGKMHDEILNFFNIKPQKKLNINYSGSYLSQLVSELYREIGNEFIEDKDDFGVIVQGDTTSAFCAANIAFLFKKPIFHVEAGLRTHDIYSPYPEEFNRKAISLISNLNFAPTLKSFENLKKELINEDKNLLTGNTIVDALLTTQKILYNNETKFVKLDKSLNFEFIKKKDYVLSTFHRRENFGENLTHFCEAIKKFTLKTNIPVIIPVHKNPNIFLPMNDNLGNIKNVFLIDTLDYPSMVFLMMNCLFLVSDSGGIQEEAPSVGKRVLVLRKTTERPEAIESGWGELVNPTKNIIYNKMIKELENKITSKNLFNPFGKGNTSKIITKHLENFFNV